MKGAKSKKIDAAKSAEILASVSATTVRAATQDLTDAQLKVQKAIAGISTEFIAKFEQLEQVNAAIGLKQDELQRLHDIEAEATKLDDLQAEIAQLYADNQEAVRLRNIQRERDEEAYRYDLAKRRKHDEDSLSEHRVHLEKGWADREATLQAAENELESLRNQVAAHSSILEAREKAAEGKGRGIAQAAFDTETRVKEAQHRADLAIRDQVNTHLKEQVAQLTARNTALESALAKAQDDNKELAKAMADASAQKELAGNLQRALETAQAGRTK